MKLCPKCDHSPLPFLMAFVIATVSAFVTWLTLGLSGLALVPRAGITALAFTVVGATLVHYVLNCLRRHCRHQEHPPRASLRLPTRPEVETVAPRLGEATA